MRIPRRLKIGGFVWQVEFRDDVAREGRCYGSTHFSRQHIYLDPNTTRQKQEQAFIHELLHAIWWQQGLGSCEAGKFEEHVIDALSMGLHQTLKDARMLSEGPRVRKGKK